MSRNMPTISSSTLTIRSSTSGSVEIDRSRRLKVCGICSIVMIQPNSAAADDDDQDRRRALDRLEQRRERRLAPAEPR